MITPKNIEKALAIGKIESADVGSHPTIVWGKFCHLDPITDDDIDVSRLEGGRKNESDDFGETSWTGSPVRRCLPT